MQFGLAQQSEQRQYQAWVTAQAQAFEAQQTAEQREYDFKVKEYFEQMWFEQQVQLMQLNSSNQLYATQAMMELERSMWKPTPMQLEDWSIAIYDLYDPSSFEIVYQTSSQSSIQNTSWRSYTPWLWWSSYFSFFEQWITSMWGKFDNDYWVDFWWNKGDPIPSSVDWEVVNVLTWQPRTSSPSYWNFVQVKDKNWNIHRFSHLDSANVKVGDKVTAWQLLGTMWNSWYAYSTKWGDWTHLDYTIKKPDGSHIPPTGISQYLDGMVWKTALHPIAQQVLDWNLRVDQVKDNVEDKNQVPYIMQQVSTFRANNNILDPRTQNIIDLAQDLKNRWWWQRAADATFGRVPFSNTRDNKKKLKQLWDFLKLDNLITLKDRWATFGALSENELVMISDSATRLDNLGSDEAWEEELDFIISSLSWKSPSEALRTAELWQPPRVQEDDFLEYISGVNWFSFSNTLSR